MFAARLAAVGSRAVGAFVRLARMHAALVAMLLLVPAVADGSASASSVPRFGSPRTVLTFPDAVGGLSEEAAGDLNGDGIADLVVTRLVFPPAHVTYPVGIVLGDGRGGFSDGSSLWQGEAPRTEHGRQILIADFNGDGRNDIFIADHGYDASPFPGHQNTLALSTPDGKLADATSTLPIESGFTHSAAAADVNGDRTVDLYVGNLCCGDQTPPELLMNDGTGHFTRRLDLLPEQVEDTRQGTYTRSLFVDANRDGAPDLVLGGFTGTDSRVLLNDGTGHFRLGSSLPTKPLGLDSILISLAPLDINGDGITDLLAGFQRKDFTDRRIQVLIGGGDGTFRDETAGRLPNQDSGVGWPYAIRVADINGDGALDFGVNVYGANEKAPLYLNDGRGVFRPVPSPVAYGGAPFEFIDTNRDGRLDLVQSLAGGPGDVERHDVQLQLVRPGAVHGLRATPSESSILITWQPLPGADAYEVWRSPKEGHRARVARVTTPKWADRTARPRLTYTYVVRAVNAVGPGPFAAPVAGRRR